MSDQHALHATMYLTAEAAIDDMARHFHIPRTDAALHLVSTITRQLAELDPAATASALQSFALEAMGIDLVPEQLTAQDAAALALAASDGIAKAMQDGGAA